jgi:hypothetical protein
MCWSQPTRIDHMCKNMWVGGILKFLGETSLGHPHGAGGQLLVTSQLWPVV